MHYFPSTYAEITEATARIRHEATIQKTALPRLIIWGRLQERAVRDSDLMMAHDWRTVEKFAALGEGELMGIPFKVDYDRPFCFEAIT